VNAALGTGDEKSSTRGILLHGVHINSRWQTFRDFLPGLAHVARAVDVRLEVLELVPIDAGVGRARVEV